jgi:hypothetical protein
MTVEVFNPFFLTAPDVAEGAGGCIMARFSFGPGGANRQLLRLERLEGRDCPSGLGGHAHTFAGILPAPPTPPPQPHGVIVHHLPAGPVAQPFAGIIEVPPTPPPQPH